MTRAFVAGIGLRGPGLNGWDASRAVLAGREEWKAADIEFPHAALLPPNERRRASLPVRLALTAAMEAIEMAGVPAQSVRGVFASANGESAILHQLLETVAVDPGAVSPTAFHNSTHNAVAGYWSMSVKSNQPVTAIGAYSGTFAAALLEASAQLMTGQSPVLMCVYDAPAPVPLQGALATLFPFACALVLTEAHNRETLAELAISWHGGGLPLAGADHPVAPFLARLSTANPAACSLRLLQPIAAGGAEHHAEFGLLNGSVAVKVVPCSIAMPSAH